MLSAYIQKYCKKLFVINTGDIKLECLLLHNLV